MVINFVGLFSQPSVTGEISDETHIARELESLGHEVNRVPRDVWKASVDGHPTRPDWLLPIKSDINLIAKWPHFDDSKYILELRKVSQAPVFYWIWDWMNEFDPANWNVKMAKASDLYLTGEGGLVGKYRQAGIPAYYFQMDVCDGRITLDRSTKKDHELIFTGSWVGKGHRQEWLTKINNEIPIEVFSWNYDKWPSNFKTYPAVYGAEYNKLIGSSKLVLGFNVEPNCYGYWSNRVGKVLWAGGNLLQEFSPGMEELVENNIEFFSSPEEAIEKAKHILQHGLTPITGDEYRFTSASKVHKLDALIERYLKRTEDWII